MTTTNDGGIHPMVLKAARTLCNQIFRGTRFDADAMWHKQREHYVCDAHEILTECGALELLEKAEYAHESLSYPPAREALGAAIAKALDVSSAGSVYGSAAE